MGMTQYHMNFSPDEDRIYIFVRQDADTEHAFGVTRRLFKRLWPALTKVIEETSEAARKATAPMKNDVLQFEKEGAVKDAVESGEVSSSALPKASDRRRYLVKTIHIKDGKHGNKVLALTDGTQTMSIGLTHERMIVLCDSLKALVKRSDWDLDLSYPWEATGDKQARPGSGKDTPTRH